MKNLTGKLLSDRWKVFLERMVILKHKSGNLGAEYTAQQPRYVYQLAKSIVDNHTQAVDTAVRDYCIFRVFLTVVWLNITSWYKIYLLPF